MSLALFFGVLVLLLVLTVPICVSFAFVTLLPSIVDASFPYTADAAVRSMVSGLNNFPLLAIPLFIIAGVIMAQKAAYFGDYRTHARILSACTPGGLQSLGTHGIRLSGGELAPGP